MVLILINVTNDVFTDVVKNNFEWKMTFGDTNNLILHVHVSYVTFVSSLSSFSACKDGGVWPVEGEAPGHHSKVSLPLRIFTVAELQVTC